MKATVYDAPGDVRVKSVPDPRIRQPSDALARVTYACICGSDLWFYREEAEWKAGWRAGHEFMGSVEDVGSEVPSLEKRGPRRRPVRFLDGACEFCRKGLQRHV